MNAAIALIQAVEEDDGFDVSGNELWIILIVLAIVLLAVLIVYYGRRM
jgi:flagellar basal body-associated protein FliL